MTILLIIIAAAGGALYGARNPNQVNSGFERVQDALRSLKKPKP